MFELRDYIQKLDSNLGQKASHLWRLSATIHSRQNKRGDPTENGRNHVEKVEEYVWNLLNTVDHETKKENIKKFNKHELFIICCTACCHDFDKGLQSSLSRKHGKGSKKFVEDKIVEFGLNKPEAQAIGHIIELHPLLSPKYEENLKKVSKTYALGGVKINLHRLAVILKTADILHTDNSRISTIVSNCGDLQDKLQKSKCWARYCIDGWRTDGSRIIIQTSPKNKEQRKAVNDCFDYIQTEEWPCVENGLQIYGFPWDIRLEPPGGSRNDTSKAGGKRPSNRTYCVLPNHKRKVRHARAIVNLLSKRDIISNPCKKIRCELHPDSVGLTGEVAYFDKNADKILDFVELLKAIRELAHQIGASKSREIFASQEDMTMLADKITEFENTECGFISGFGSYREFLKSSSDYKNHYRDSSLYRTGRSSQRDDILFAIIRIDTNAKEIGNRLTENIRKELKLSQKAISRAIQECKLFADIKQPGQMIQGIFCSK